MIKIDKKYLPSKKFLISLSIAAGIILLVILLNYLESAVSKYKNNHLATNTNASSSPVNIDSDSDGLPDWKEALYGTDLKKTDTDGDGASDSEEIAQSRDPLKANTSLAGQEPNDKIDPAVIAQNEKIIADYRKLSETDKFSQDLISNIIASQPASGSMDQNTIDSIIAKAMAEIPEKNFIPSTKIADLNLLKTDSTNLNENMTVYSANFYIEMKNLLPILGNDESIINSFISGSASARSEMIKLTNKYQAAVNNLVKMPVPVAIGYYDVNYHLRVINDLEIIIAVDKDIINSDRTSLGIFNDLAIYNSVTKDLISTLTTIGSILGKAK